MSPDDEIQLKAPIINWKKAQRVPITSKSPISPAINVARIPGASLGNLPVSPFITGLVIGA
ncbi:hypothetical protein A2777_03850 [Candidatus Gottesmanbacteria bacterium RIFCSPHIGHO2_01_FULL_40_15]|uniref:Uncharacterized protein n=1 Tax=Candidatus Gottesmanbacteria bacterium RIFCSPHIGHO2_01_FULL_40_15 TaxID=1798376 RepID=A0A1F5Z478_9BACT|nr:MAG: hypothetical protein A2777_03850 [Candidatus Gottesmanbacteria bacterium RIFCSPHIGHO2_01_FULL_40_15]